ncbi:MAG: ribokinase [Thermomicrobiales bacterium]
MTIAQGSILVAGAINTDLVASVTRAPAAGETVTGSGFSIHGGGKGANQAVAIARSEGDAYLVGAIGDDVFGHARLIDLIRDGVHTASVIESTGQPSGVALILVEDGGENRIAYVPGATLTMPQAHMKAAFSEIQPSIVLATNELPHNVLRVLFTAARNAGATVVFNVTPEPETARDLIRDVSILIANSGEAATLLEIEEIVDTEDAVASLLKLGPETVILTLGHDGACFGTRNELAWHRPPGVDVVDTTGAGDTFCGAFVAELARSATIDDAVRYGVVASALSVTRKGAQSSIPTRSEILGR